MSEEERQRLVYSAEGRAPNGGTNTSDPTENNEDGGEEQLLFEDVPVYTTCPFCQEKIVTRTHFKSGKYTYWTSVCLCIFQ